MATYDENQKARIMGYPIENVLAHFGKRTDHRGEMYFSPFRDEAEPSFHIKRSENVWMDFGTGQGGNVLTLVNLLAGISLSDCWDYVASLEGSGITFIDTPAPSLRRTSRSSRIIIDSVISPFKYRGLVAYAQRRGIPRHILERYCSEVSYHIDGQYDRKYTAIGFPAGDGWVLRHSYDGPFSKRCTGSSCSLLGASGESTLKPTCERVEVFEGFFDFLSWLVLKDITKPFADICVLNSVNNIDRGLEFISGHRDISVWTDCDQAGYKALDTLKGRCSGVRDHIAEMAGCNDVNELLLQRSYQKNVIPSNIQNNSLTIKK